MTQLQIAGHIVEVDDSFLKASPEIQQKTVNEIGASLERSKAPDTPGPTPSWSDLPAAALAAAPRSAGKLVTNIGEGIGHAIAHPLDTLDSVAHGINSLALNIPGAEALNSFGDKYGILPRDAAAQQRDVTDKAAGAALIGKKVGEYATSEGFRNRMGNDPFGYVGDAAAVFGPKFIGKGFGLAGDVGSAVASKARALNKFKTQYPEVAQSVAQDLHNMHSTGEYDVGNLDTAKGAVTKAHYNNGEELKANRTLLNDYFDPKQATGSGDAALRLEAAKAFKSSTHQVADHPLASEIDAVNKLVGHTQQGYELVHGLKKHVELQNIRKNIQGGVSQYTDMLNPLQIGQGRFGLKGLPGLALAGAQYSNPLGLMGAMGQAGVVVGGKLVDAARGMPNGSNAMRYMKQNLDAPVANVGQGLEDVVATKASAQAAMAKAAADSQELRLKQASEAAAAKKAISDLKMRDAADKANANFDTKAAQTKSRAKAALAKSKEDAAQRASKAADDAYKQDYRTATLQNKQLNFEKAAEAKATKAAETEVAKTTKVSNKEQASSQKATEAPHDPAVIKDSSGKVVNHLVEWNKKIAKVTKAHAHATRAANHRPKHLHAAISHIIKTATKALTEAPNAKAKSGVHTFQKVREDILKSALSKTSSPAGHAYVLKALTPLVEIWRDGLDHMATSKVEPPQKSILKKRK